MKNRRICKKRAAQMVTLAFSVPLVLHHTRASFWRTSVGARRKLLAWALREKLGVRASHAQWAAKRSQLVNDGWEKVYHV